YEVDGDVFFEVTKFKGYGKLSGRTLEEMRAGERVEVNERKHHPMDFALWKSAKPGEPSWDSPWGKGRPGWHIECSVMSLKHLGNAFDIHGGGQDLIFPHHENEIAQSEAYTGSEPFVRYWLHNGFVNVRGEKMAKSVGNVVLVKELFDMYNPLVLRNALRVFFISHHYRSPVDCTDTSIDEAIEAYERLENAFLNIEEALSLPIALKEVGKEKDFEKIVHSVKEKFIEAMDDDFNTSLALAALFDFAREINTFLDALGLNQTEKTHELLKEAKVIFSEITQVLGLKLGFLDKPDLFLESAEKEKLNCELGSLAKKYSLSTAGEIALLVDKILEFRRNLREKRIFEEADRIRRELFEIGIEAKDVNTPKGYKWRLNLKKVMALHGNN
ncbi:MAG: cysteine--tRNA ligase, partial [Candidatus Subteraquimicrobiales bacterium]|nr:cysteine--tRNA ligase [Candidatus Subteraquimicrobiales bacterium]